MSRADEIAQGLRHESGALTFPLEGLEYGQGYQDFKEGRPSPRGLTSPSYDLGRARGRREAEERADLLARLDREQAESRQRVREMLKGRPDVLADYDAKMAEIDARRDEARLVRSGGRLAGPY